jgi:multiple sugar transport system permease protein
MNKHAVKKKLAKVTRAVLIIVVFVIWAFPILWLISGSFRPSQSIIEGKFFESFVPTLEHYKDVMRKQNYITYTLNSMLVACFATVVSVSVGILAAYSVTRFKTGGKVYSNWIVFTRMAPPAILIIPFYLMFKSIGLINTIWALVIANITFNIPFVVWTMKGFFEALPEEIEESAMIEGCTRVESLFRIVIPVSRSGILTASIFCFLFTWNEYLFGTTLALSEQSKTLPVAVGNFITGYAINWGPFFAAGSMIVLPALVMVIFLQSYIVDGLTVGSIK